MTEQLATTIFFFVTQSTIDVDDVRDVIRMVSGLLNSGSSSSSDNSSLDSVISRINLK